MKQDHAWFASEAISDTLRRIWEPKVHLFFQANIYHLIGKDADLVVDFGTGLHSLRTFLEIAPGKPVIALASHVHIDHVGSFHEFDRRLGHEAEASGFKSMDDRETLANLFRDEPEAVSDRPYPDWRAQTFVIPPAPLTEIVEQGSRIDTGSHTFTVLHLPGHSPGSIGLIDERNGLFFSGDAIYNGRISDNLPGSDRRVYRKTMENLLSMDAAAVYGGHGEPMSETEMHTIAAQYLHRESEP